MAPPNEPTTLHERLVRELREEVRRSGKAGARLPGDRALAARFGVSNVSIRDAMLTLAEQGWVERRWGSGTYVADRARRRHVGILIVADLLHEDLADIWRQETRLLRDRLEELGHEVRIYSGRDTPWGPHDNVQCPEFDEAVADDRLCGLVALGTEPEARWYHQLLRRAVPMVFLGDYADTAAHCIFPDFAQLGRDTARSVLEAGRERVALLQWLHPRPSAQCLPDRYWEAFIGTLTGAGITPNPHWVRKDLHPSLRGAGWSELREIWAASPVKPNGLIIADDNLLPDAAEAIVQLGIRVPEQLLVVVQTNALTPVRAPFPVVAWEFDPRRTVEATVDALGRLLAGETPAALTCIPFQHRDYPQTEPIRQEASHARTR